jgi:hypothetical protein
MLRTISRKKSDIFDVARQLVTVQPLKTRALIQSPYSYPVPMETPPALRHEVWERTPPEAKPIFGRWKRVWRP